MDYKGVLLDLDPEKKKKLVKASWLVEDAFRGFSRAHPQATTKAEFYYKLYHRLTFLRRLAVFVLLMLSFVETPYWCHGVWPYPCGDLLDPMTPLTSGMLLIPKRESVLIEVVCISVCLINEIFLFKSLGRNFFTRFDRVCSLVLFWVDFTNAMFRLTFSWLACSRIAPFLRLAIFIMTFRSIRSTYRKMYLVMAEVQVVIALVGVYIGFFAWLATILFRDTDEADTMVSFTESAWQLLILLTTANFPDVMMPAYTRNRAYGLFFILFVSFGLFFMMNLILAQVFSNYQRIAAADNVQNEKNRTKLLMQAFDILVSIQEELDSSTPSRQTPPPKGTSLPSPGRQQVHSIPKPSSPTLVLETSCTWIDTELAVSLFEELNHYNVASTRMKRKDMIQLFRQLDADEDGSIELPDFFTICDRMREFEIAYHKPPSEVERFWPGIAASNSFQKLCLIVQHKLFELAIDCVLVLNALCIFVESIKSEDNLEGGSWLEIAQVIFSSIYVLEMLLKLTVLGIQDYVHSFRNCFDALITVVSLAVDIYAYIPNSFSDHTVPKLLMTFRCVRMLRLFLSIERFRVIIMTAWAMIPIGKNLLLVMFCNLNAFALVGHQLFGGRISPGLLETPLFTNSTYAACGYAANNFNDIPSGIVTLFELLVVNNWFVIVEGHVRVSSVWSRLFFIAFWITGVIMTLNLIVASILDAFSSEYSAAQEMSVKSTKTPLIHSPQLSPKLRHRLSQSFLLQTVGEDETHRTV